MINVKNVKYNLIDSKGKEKKVTVSFIFNNKTYEYDFTLEGKANLKDAKNKFEADLKSGAVEKALGLNKKSHKKPLIIALISLAGVAAASCAGFFIWKANQKSKWKLTTKEKALEMRDEILKEQRKYNAFDLFSKVLGGKQFNVNFAVDGLEFSQCNENIDAADYQIDSDEVYVGQKITEEGGAPSIEYFTYHETQESKGLYFCHSKSGKKETELSYNANDINDARKKFTLDNENVNDDIELMYGYRFIGSAELENTCLYIFETFGKIEGVKSILKYYIADNFSFKITGSAKGKGNMEGYGEVKVDASINCVAEDALLKKFECNFEILDGKNDMTSATFEYTLKKTSFTPDDLSEYFK